jgi:hypothetical protein
LHTSLDGLYRDLAESWCPAYLLCLAILNGEKTLTGYVALGKPFHLRAPIPVLSMVAVELMAKLETFIAVLSEWRGEDKKVLHGAWFAALGAIVYFQLPVHEESDYIDGDGGCWTVSRAFLLTRPC